MVEVGAVVVLWARAQGESGGYSHHHSNESKRGAWGAGYGSAGGLNRPPALPRAGLGGLAFAIPICQEKKLFCLASEKSGEVRKIFTAFSASF